MRIFHLIDPDEWTAALDADEYHPPSLAAEGFVHFSFAEQVAATANRHYPQAERLSVVEFDPERLDAPVVVEASFGGMQFPHVYAPIPPAAAVAVHEVHRVDGEWVFTPGDATGPASTGR